MLRYFAAVLSALMLTSLLAACAGDAPSGRIDRGGVYEQSPTSLTDYQLGPGDQLRIVVFDEPSLSSEFVVGPQGTIAFPLIGEAPAAGMTAAEFSRSLEAKLRSGYVRDPKVSSEVLVYRPFYILGQVMRPGTYPFVAGLTVVSAAATAGGFSYRADTHRVYIKHVGQERETSYELTSKTPVLPGDTVRIGERLF